MKVKLKVGFFPVAGNSILELADTGKDNKVLKGLLKNVGSMMGIINKEHDLISNGIITCSEEADNAKEKFKAEDIDVIIVSNIIYSEDQLILNILKEFKYIPVIVWSYSPIDNVDFGMTMEELMITSGPCGTFQSLPAIFRLDRKLKFVYGKPEELEVKEKINNFLDVILTLKKLKNSRIALMPYRWDTQTDTMVDESLLSNLFGPEISHYSYNDLYKFVCKVDEKKVSKYFIEVKRKYKIEDVRDEVLKLAIRSSLAFKDFAIAKKVNAISYNEMNPDILEIIGLNPVLYLDDLYNNVDVLGGEGDLPSITMLLIFRFLTVDGIMFTEFMAPNRKDNFLFTAHQGNHNIKTLVNKDSDVKIVQDFELRNSKFNIHKNEGAWMSFVAKEGIVTFGQIVFYNGKFKLTYFKGKSLGKKIVDYYPQASIEIPICIDDFIYRLGKIGCGHHWMFAYGDLRERLKDLSNLLDIESIDIEEIN